MCFCPPRGLVSEQNFCSYRLIWPSSQDLFPSISVLNLAKLDYTYLGICFLRNKISVVVKHRSTSCSALQAAGVAFLISSEVCLTFAPGHGCQVLKAVEGHSV